MSVLAKLSRPFSLPGFLADLVAEARVSSGSRRAFLLQATDDGHFTSAADGAPAHELMDQDERIVFGPFIRPLSAGKPLTIADTLRSSRDKDIQMLAGMGIRTMVMYPVGRNGALVCYQTEPEKIDTTPLLELANAAELAIEVSRLRAERIVDELTGAMSHRALLSRVQDEVSRSSSNGRPASLLLVDPDGTATLSESQLKQIVRSLRESIRPIDHFARFAPDPDDPDDRYGGDEFYILLPETNRTEAAALAEKIRTTIRPACSIGIASVPEDADSSETLLMAVDEALSRARSRGHSVSFTTGPVEVEEVVSAELNLLSSREGRVLEEMLRRVFSTEQDLPQQLDLTASLISATVDAHRSLVVTFDPHGNWLAVGRDNFEDKEEGPIRDLVSETVKARESRRGEEKERSLAVPISLNGRIVAVAYVERKEGDLSDFQRTMLSALAGRIGSELAGSIRFQKRREEVEERRAKIKRTVSEIRQKHDFSAIVGEGPRLLEVLQLVARAAETDAPVLILGESGTGKELVARAVHNNSKRKKGPFVVLNCAAIPMTLLESELFGHIKGAFTGATNDRKGMFETARGGTIFLDEIGEMPLETQAKLLRAVQFGEVQHLGSDSTVKVNTRVVAATNRDLARAVQEKEFREDLFFRINVFQVEVPPLREHREDVAAITGHVLKQISSELGRTIDIEPDVAKLLHQYAFPGNVRELENILIRAAALAAGNTITTRDLPDIVQGGSTQPYQYSVPRNADELARLKKHGTRELTDNLERAFINYILTRTAGNVSEAARLTGFNRTSLQKLLTRHKIVAGEFKPSK